MEKWLLEHIFTQATVYDLLDQISQRFLSITQPEIELMARNPLDYFIYCFDESNLVPGNYVREQSRNLIGYLRLRVDELCQSYRKDKMIKLKEALCLGDDNLYQSQTERDSIYQMILLLIDEDEKESEFLDILLVAVKKELSLGEQN